MFFLQEDAAKQQGAHDACVGFKGRGRKFTHNSVGLSKCRVLGFWTKGLFVLRVYLATCSN